MDDVHRSLFTSRQENFYLGPLEYSRCPQNLAPFVPPPPLDENSLQHTFQPEDYTYLPRTPLIRTTQKRIRDNEQEDTDE